MKSTGLLSYCVLLFLTTCSTDAPAPPAATPGATSPAAAPSTAAPVTSPSAATNTPTAAQAPAAPTTQPTAPASIAAAESDRGAGVRIEVTQLKRSGGGTVDLRLTLVNDSDIAVRYGGNFEPSLADVTLIDLVGKRKYFVVKDGDGECVCSSRVFQLESRSRANMWARFPAPPEDVERLSIVIPRFSPIDDVPLSR